MSEPSSDRTYVTMAGKCIGGPYEGKEIIGQFDTLVVHWLEGAFKREGHYEFLFGQWRWASPPSCRPVGGAFE